ncbi:MAG: hypothetical protein JRH18_06755 [Deltaproteobacteria bacterium]|nr:hypothetical protein [Deltaproteobacteria bacterium]MBW2151353.1 hypothetical protein [Deltaproteobacteria bacterium]
MKIKVQKPKNRFEPITDRQNRKLHVLGKTKSPSEKHLYQMVEDLIGIPSISALSKQEASLIIKKMDRSNSFSIKRPTCIQHRAPIGNSNLPNLSHIRGIRMIARELGWDKDHLKNWLKKYMKASSIRELDAETARKAFIGMKKIQSYKEKKKTGTTNS